MISRAAGRSSVMGFRRVQQHFEWGNCVKLRCFLVDFTWENKIQKTYDGHSVEKHASCIKNAELNAENRRE